MGKWGYALGTFIDRLDWILVGLTTTAMAFITVISFIEVVSRYCFNAPHGWVAEIVVLLMVWTVFLAVGPGLKRGNHVAVSFLADALHGRVRRLHQVFVNLCSFVVLSVVTWLGVYLFMDFFRFVGCTETLMLPHWIA